MKHCGMCKETKPSNEYNKGGSRNNTYCRECQKIYNNKKHAKQRQKILEATNYGKCWWVYQSIMGDLTFWRKK